MILPNKDVPFEKSLLKYSIDIYKSIEEKMKIEELYKKSHLKTKDMDAIMEIADRHHLYVVEDCAQGYGCNYGFFICY